MARRRNTSRLKRIEEKRNRNQAILFGLLTFGFLLLLLFVGFPLFVDLVGTLGDVRSDNRQIDKNDTYAPFAPNLIDQFEATNSSQITVSGFSESGSKVFLMVNGSKQAEKVVADDGAFSFESITLDKGNNEIYAYAQDLAGNKSDESKTLNIIYDSQAPDLEITSPQNGDKFYYEDQEILVAGHTEENARARVNGFIATVDTEGNFVKRIQLNNGKNIITVEVEDQAGNKNSDEIEVEYFD